MEIKAFGEKIKRCDLDHTLCNCEKCIEDPSYQCDYKFDVELSKKVLLSCEILAAKILDAELRRKPLGAEHIEAAKTIIALKNEMRKRKLI